jgi:serine/threonine protein kinase
VNNTQPRPQLGREAADSQDGGTPARNASDPPSTTELPPALANHSRYRVVRLLGQGGMGAVYEAEHQLMNRKVALKVINHSLTERPASVERIRQEVRAAARLDHSNIVRAYDAEQAGDAHFLVMEYVEGTDLARLVRQRGPLPVAQACHFVRQAALGLQHAYEHGMVHRDIKPHNLMVTRRGRVKILDFGLARFASEAGSGGPLTQSGAVLGTPDYIAPEQALDAHAADIRADLYSLGCTFYHLRSGRVPFPGDSLTQKLLAHQLSQPEPLGDLRPGLPPGLVAVVEKLMAKKPEERYQTPAEVAQALAPYVRQGPAAQATAPAPSVPVVDVTLVGDEDRVIERAPAARRGPARGAGSRRRR